MAGADSRGRAAPGEDVKPFTPEKTREIVMSLQQPAVFCNMVGDWPALHWDVKHLSAMLDGKTIQFRIGLKAMDLGQSTPVFKKGSVWTTSFLEHRDCIETPEEALPVPMEVVGLHHITLQHREICFLHIMMFPSLKPAVAT